MKILGDQSYQISKTAKPLRQKKAEVNKTNSAQGFVIAVALEKMRNRHAFITHCDNSV